MVGVLMDENSVNLTKLLFRFYMNKIAARLEMAGDTESQEIVRGFYNVFLPFRDALELAYPDMGHEVSTMFQMAREIAEDATSNVEWTYDDRMHLFYSTIGKFAR